MSSRQRSHTAALWRSDAFVASAAAIAAALAFWLTLSADFLAHPGWLAVQKADAILGPVLAGVYWRRRRPESRFGQLLIAVGFLTVPYILQSVASPWAFAVGVAWEAVIYVATLTLILAFPTGRLHGITDRALLAAGTVGAAIPFVAIVVLSPDIRPDGSISACASTCPRNGLFVRSFPSLTEQLADVYHATIAVVAILGIVVIVQRFATGTPPRRRALAVGAPIALVFFSTQAIYQAAQLFDLNPGSTQTTIQWAIVAARSSLWYGFFLALIVAELFAGRMLRRTVEAALRRPPLEELETLLKKSLGDPSLRLAFGPSDRNGGDGDRSFAPASGQVLTTIESEGQPAVALVHDGQLAEEPELIHAAGTVALLAEENARLEVAWSESVRELRMSRARIAAAGDLERRALERDLHDGAQQRLTAILLQLAILGELVDSGSIVGSRIAGLESELEAAIDELRRLGHGIYPASLVDAGLVAAFEAVAQRSGTAITFASEGVGRYAPEIESVVYFCCLEALQNATKHAGAGAHISIRLQASNGMLQFQVSDDGIGFESRAWPAGSGLRNMRDRLDAFDGEFEITSSPGHGTVVSGALTIT